MRTSFLTLALCALACLGGLSACDDNFQEAEKGQLSVMINNEVTGNPGLIAFRFVPVGASPDVQIFSLKNISEKASIKVNEIVLETNSPAVILYHKNQPALCQQGRCPLAPFDLGPLAAEQFDVHFKPESTDLQCGAPPPGAPAGWCGTITIITNEPGNPRFSIYLTVPEQGGELRVCLEPDACTTGVTLAYSAATIHDAPQTRVFYLRNTGANQLTIKSIQNSLTPPAEFTLTGPSVPLVLQPNGMEMYSLIFTRLSDDAEPRQGTLIFASDANDTASVGIEIGSPHAAHIDVFPTSLAFINVPVGQSRTQTLSISNVGGATAAALMVSVALDPNDTTTFTVFDANGLIRAGLPCAGGSPPATCREQITIVRGDAHEIAVTYNAQSNSDGDAILRLTSNDPDEADRVIDVPLRVSGEVAFLDLEPAVLTWAHPALGNPETKTVTLTNQGTLPLNCSGIAKSNFSPTSGEALFVAELVDVDFPLTLAPGADKTLEITFTRPADESVDQAYKGDLVIAHDGQGGESILSVSVAYP